MRRKITAGFLLVLISALLAGCGPGEPKVRSVMMVAAEVAENEKAQSVDTYSAGQEELLLYGKALNFAEDDHITVRWIYEEAGEYELCEDTEKKGFIYEFYSRIENGGHPWPAGAYRVEVYVNDKDTPDATVRFTVE